MKEVPRTGPFRSYSYREELLDSIREMQRFYGLEARATKAELLAMSDEQLADEFDATNWDGMRKRARERRERRPFTGTTQLDLQYTRSGMHISERSG